MFDIAMEILTKGVSHIGVFSTIYQFSHILFNTGYRGIDPTCRRHAENVNPKEPEVQTIMFELAVEFLKRNNILKSGEAIEILDTGRFVIGKNSGHIRSGPFVVTQNRLLSLGKDRRDDFSCYILYPDVEEHDYYGSVDYIEFDADDTVKLKWGLIMQGLEIWKQNLPHIRTWRRQLYGPLFYRYRLADGAEAKTGKFRLRISLTNFKGRTHLRERLERLLEVIRRGIASASIQNQD